MQKGLILVILVFSFIYLHKLQRLMRRERVETYCNEFQHNDQQVRDCVACINTQKITSASLKFYINNIDSKYQSIPYYGSVKVLKQEKCWQYQCHTLLDSQDYELRTSKEYLQQLTFKSDFNTTIDSEEKEEIDIKLKGVEAAVALRFRVIQTVRSNTSMFVTVRYTHEDIIERLVISLIGVAVPRVNYLLLFAFLPGLESVMQAYMIWCVLEGVVQNKYFPIVYSLVYFCLSHLTEIELYRDLFLLSNVLASVIVGMLKPTKQSIFGVVITIISVTSQYTFQTKDLVQTSTIMGYYFTLLGLRSDDKPKEEFNWTAIHI